MSEKPLTFGCLRSELMVPEDDIVAIGERPRAQGRGGFSCSAVRVNTGLAEVVVKMRLKQPARSRIKRTARADAVHQSCGRAGRMIERTISRAAFFELDRLLTFLLSVICYHFRTSTATA